MSLITMKKQHDDSYPQIFGNGEASSFALVRQLYQDEIRNDYEPLSKIVSISFPVDEAIVLSLVAKRFGMSLSAFLNRFLDGAARDAFLALDPKDRLAIGKQADIDLIQFEKEKGITPFPSSINDPIGRWEKSAIYHNEREEKEVEDYLREKHQQEMTQSLLANAVPVSSDQESNNEPV
jgi:hypothetical protein